MTKSLIWFIFSFFFVLFARPEIGNAAIVTTVYPTSDGSLYVCNGCNTTPSLSYVLVSGYIQGDIKFAASDIPKDISQAFLELNPYGLPLWGPTVAVYGYGSNSGTINISDANTGSFLGNFNLPSDLGYGQIASFDVTRFVQENSSPYIGFDLISTGTDVFSSSEYNYGNPPELETISAVPLPGAAAMFIGALGALGMTSRIRFSTRKGYVASV